MNHRTKWLSFAPLGLTLTGLGLTVALDASNRKARGDGWFWQGTLGLVLFNAGLSVFGESVKARVRYEQEQ